MGGKKKGGFFSKWMKSDLPDREENSNQVLLLAVHNTLSNSQQDKTRSNNVPSSYANYCDNLNTHPEPQKHFFSQISERFRKTLSLDYRTNCDSFTYTNNELRPKSMVNSPNFTINVCSNNTPNTSRATNKVSKNRHFRPKSFFSLETFLDSKRSENSSADDFSSSKYCKFYVDSSNECSPVLKGRTTPDLLDLPDNIEYSHVSEELKYKKRLDKLENHFNKIQKLKNSQLIHNNTNCIYKSSETDIEEPLYVEPINEKCDISEVTDIFGINSGEICDRKAHNHHHNIINDNINCECKLSNQERYFHNRCNVFSHNSNSSLNSVERINDFEASNIDTPIDFGNKNIKSNIQDSQNCEFKTSQSSVGYCGGFGLKEYSNALRNACCANRSNSFLKNNLKRICCKESTPSSAYEINVTKDDILSNERTKNLVVKTMDKSVDSIGSCSLDVDADNTDFSDTTSGSLNILTPSSTTSHYRDFALKFHERVTPALHQDIRRFATKEESNVHTGQNLATNSNNLSQSHTSGQSKKPSYLHLACSINGYSNLTTYNSTLRQRLNKSREQSPARLGNISSYILQNYPNENMAQQINVDTSNINSNTTFFKTSYSETSISSQKVITYLKTNGENICSETHTSKSYNIISNGNGDASPSKSFIEQRVERLYGPGALAQGFFNQKKQIVKDKVTNGEGTSPHSRISKPEYMSPRISLNGNSSNYSYNEENEASSQEEEPILPVFRHLRAEFRAQLPLLSPKRSPLSKISDNSNNLATNIEIEHIKPKTAILSNVDTVDKGVDFVPSHELINNSKGEKPLLNIIPIIKYDSTTEANVSGEVKNGIDNSIDSFKTISSVVKNNQFVDTSNNVSVTNTNIEQPNVTIVDDSSKLNHTNQGQQEIMKSDDDTANVSGGEDGYYFLNLCRTEMERLEQLARSAEKHLEDLKNFKDVNEEVTGFLRVAAGKARLLASEKMKQFEGLCFKNVDSQPDDKFPTTIADLRGFWDMVYLQVEDIRILFEQIDVMRKSNWKEIPITKKTNDAPSKLTSNRPRTLNVKKSTKLQSETTAKSSELSKKRDEQRKALIEAKRRASKMQTNSPVEIFVPSSLSDKVEEKS